MKKAYNPDWIKNIEIQHKATDWLSKNLLEKPQLETIKAAFPVPFYRPGFFVRIGLFLFVTIACAFSVTLVTLIFAGDNATDQAYSVISLICAVFCIVFLEMHIKSIKLFHSGVDNALLYAGIALLFVPVFALFKDLKIWQYSLVLSVVLTLATARYADLLTAAGAFVAWFVTLANLLMNFSAGTMLLPFSAMLLTACIYFPVRKNSSIYYANCCKLLQILSLATFYLASNYLIVREGNALLTDPAASISRQIPFATVFYIFTIVIPFAYICMGIRLKDRILLHSGLLALACSVYTFGHYYSPFTGSQEIFLSGICLISLSALLIRHLHTPRYGLSDEPEEQNIPGELKSILIAQTLGQDPETKGIEFGGGNFGGGGAGEVY